MAMPTLTLQANFKSCSKERNFSSLPYPGYKRKHHPLHEPMKWQWMAYNIQALH